MPSPNRERGLHQFTEQQNKTDTDPSLHDHNSELKQILEKRDPTTQILGYVNTPHLYDELFKDLLSSLQVDPKSYSPHHDAEDILHQAIKNVLHRQRPETTFRTQNDLRHFLHTCINNARQDHYRKAPMHRELPTDSVVHLSDKRQSEQPDDSVSQLDAYLTDKENREKLHRFVLTHHFLTNQQEKIYVRRIVEGRSFIEIAQEIYKDNPKYDLTKEGDLKRAENTVGRRLKRLEDRIIEEIRQGHVL